MVRNKDGKDYRYVTLTTNGKWDGSTANVCSSRSMCGRLRQHFRWHERQDTAIITIGNATQRQSQKLLCPSLPRRLHPDAYCNSDRCRRKRRTSQRRTPYTIFCSIRVAIIPSILPTAVFIYHRAIMRRADCVSLESNSTTFAKQPQNHRTKWFRSGKPHPSLNPFARPFPTLTQKFRLVLLSAKSQRYHEQLDVCS